MQNWRGRSGGRGPRPEGSQAELGHGVETAWSSDNQTPLPDRLSQLQWTERAEGGQAREGPSPRHFPLGHPGGYKTSALQSTPSRFPSSPGASLPLGLTTEHRLQKDSRIPGPTPAPDVGRPISLVPGDFGTIFQHLGPVQPGVGLLLAGRILLLVNQKLRIRFPIRFPRCSSLS